MPRNTRIHVALELGSERELLLPAASSAHLLRVLRLRPGAALTLFNGQGGEYSAELLGAEKGQARVRVGEFSSVERESPLQVKLLQGIARGERMDLIVQKATELGVCEIVPLSCEFSVVRLAAHALARRRERWQAVAISACEQCGRNRPPRVHDIAELDVACGDVTSGEASLRLMLVPEASESLSALARVTLQHATLLVGPEGGLSGREQLLAQRAGFRACRLGPRTLRTETAPLAALAALQALAGDLAS
jgi:16S rRNA (uracil1498-N3)-methyltransferase